MDHLEEHHKAICANKAVYALPQSKLWENHPRLFRSVRDFICLLALVPAITSADVVIELIDGQRIVLPVDKHEVKSIGFTDSSVEGLQESKRERIAGTTSGEQSSDPQTWRVGSRQALKHPSEAARKAGNGDIVEIDAGIYHNDYATWSQNDITIRGIGGPVHLKSKGLIPNGKAIWILKGNNIVIENVEFSGAAVKDGNGAGIRHQGGDLSLRNTFFHDNEFSVLSGRRPDSNISVISSRFWFQKRKNRYTHGIYIGEARSFKLIGSHFKGNDEGHQVKSRALENHILYNRIEDVPGADSSRLIDLPNCGLSFIIGNDLHQAATSKNYNAIGYGHEGCQKRTEVQMMLYVINNTLVNEAKEGTFVDNRAGGDAKVSNNLLLGSGELLVGGGEEFNNVRAKMVDRGQQRWNAPPGSAAINSAVQLPRVEGLSLTPSLEFNPPIGTRKRPKYGELDVGSREAKP